MPAWWVTGDVMDTLRALPDDSVDLVFTSPPFLALRSYLPADHPDKKLEGGSQPTPAAFVDWLLTVCDELGRVLAPHGTLCIELGDTYAGSGGAGGDYAPDGMRDGQPKFKAAGGNMPKYRRPQDGPKANVPFLDRPLRGTMGWPLDKSLSLVPEAFRLSLTYGRNVLGGEWVGEPWRIRNVVRWCRPNPPVGALGDKFRPATTDVVVACRARTRWFDLEAVRTEGTEPGAVKRKRKNHSGANPSTGWASDNELIHQNPAGAPPLDWLNIPTEPYKGSHYACVDADTEALTPGGWKRHDQLRDGDLIATVDESCESWSFQPATFHRYPFDGELVAIDKRVTSQRLTPNHRVVHTTRKNRTPRIRRADDLTVGCHVPLAAEMEPGGVGPGEKAAALAGWVCAEGSVPDGRWPVVHQSLSANPANCDTIRGLLDSLGADHRERHRHRVGVTGKQHVMATFDVRGALGEWLRQFHKNLPLSAVFGWGEADCRALFDALIDGDGHRRPDGRMSFIQKSKATAERFQMLAVRLGYRTTMARRARGMWQVFVSPGRWVDLRSGLNGLESAISREHYEGVVWCPSVGSGLWFARRNGQPFITGNTWPRRLVVPFVESSCPRRVCRTCGEPSRRITGRSNDLNADRPQAKRAMELAEAAGLTDEHFAAIRSFGISDAGKAQVTESGHGKNSAEVKRLAGEAKDALGGYFREFILAPVITEGWTDCGHDDWRPGRVLEPFAGSGTTLQVATGHGRDAIGIDLDERNHQLARERVGMWLVETTAEALAVELDPQPVTS